MSQNSLSEGAARTKEVYKMILDGRQLPETIMKSIALHIACFYAFGHLLGLQGHTVRNQRNMILALFVFPMLPVVLLLRDIFDIVISLAERYLGRMPAPNPAMNWEYYLSGAFGVQAEAAKRDEGYLSRHILACRASNHKIEKTRQEYDWRWAARIFFWFIFTAQSVMSLYLVIRRMRLSTDYEIPDEFRKDSTLSEESRLLWFENEVGQFADSPLDHLNGAVALGGIATGLSIIGNLLLNLEWEHEPPATRNQLDTPGAEADAPCSLLVAICESLFLTRTFRTFYYPAFAISILRATNSFPRGNYSAILQTTSILNTVYALLLPLACIYILFKSTLALKHFRSARYSEACPFTVDGFFGRTFFIPAFARAMVLGYAYSFVRWYNICLDIASGGHAYLPCTIPYWFWKDGLADKLYVP